MHEMKRGTVAVIFLSQRNGVDETGYAGAAAAMDALAREQPGYLGISSVRGTDGEGITISYWTDEAAALAWRQQAEHAAIRQLGRERWYDRYAVIVSEVTRAYSWARDACPLSPAGRGPS